MEATTMFNMCLKKRKYSFERAERVRRKVMKERGVKLRVYHCPVCDSYHVTKQVEENMYYDKTMKLESQ